MRGFLKEIKNVAVNRATNRINQTLGGLISPMGRGIPNNIGGTFQTNVYRNLNKNPFAGELFIQRIWVLMTKDTMCSFLLMNRKTQTSILVGQVEEFHHNQQETLGLLLHK